MIAYRAISGVPSAAKKPVLVEAVTRALDMPAALRTVPTRATGPILAKPVAPPVPAAASTSVTPATVTAVPFMAVANSLSGDSERESDDDNSDDD
eukprot:2820745-Pleurochrysis_carterae.AAC.2